MQLNEHKVSQITSEAIFAVPSMKPLKVLIAMLLGLILIIVDLTYETSNQIRGYSKDILKPIISLGNIPHEIFTSVRNFSESKEELNASFKLLKQENEKLSLVNSLLKEVSSRNSELGFLWSTIEENKDSYSLSRKVHLSSNPLRPVLTLDIGNTDPKLIASKAVLSKKGVIGRVESTGWSSVEVMLVQDPRSNIPVISSSSRLHGIVQGRGLGREGRLINIKKTASFKVGEELYSSSVGDIFPLGFYVAKISTIEDKPDNEFLDIKVSFLNVPSNEDYFLIFSAKKPKKPE